jgi:zinc/manganese transport system permease protein
VLLASAFYAVTRRYLRQIPLEAVIGVSYAIATAAALFLVGVAPGGHVHVQHMLAGSLLWVTREDLIWCLGVFAVVGACFGVLRRRFARLSEDYDAAAAAGVNVLAWDFLFYCLAGLVITLAVRICGVVLVFSFLIIPAVISALFTTRPPARLALAWGAGAAASLLGLVFAERLDFSMGPAIAALLGATLILAAVVRRCRGLTGAAVVLASLVAYGLALAAGGARRDAAGRPRPLPPTVAAPLPREPGADSRPAEGLTLTEKLTGTTDAAALKRLFESASTPADRVRVIERARELSGEKALDLAIGFLREDPPLYFRQQVIGMFLARVPELADYDFTQPFAAAANRECVARIRRKHGIPAP